MNLYERYKNGEFEKVTERKIVWEKRAQPFDVVKIDIKELRYNVLNGRIAELALDDDFGSGTDEGTYQDIKDRITSKSKDDIKKLGQDIGRVGLKDSLIVNRDGVIIDGNRRYTAISMLLNDEIQPFVLEDLDGLDKIECIVLNSPTDSKAIKTLEYTIQFDDMKKDYDPIARAFDFARSVHKRNMTVAEIHEATGIKVTEIQKDLRTVDLIRVLLMAVGEKGNVKFAMKLKLDGPIKEIASNKDKTKFYLEDQQALVNIVLGAIAMGTDTTRNVRAIVSGHKGKQTFESSAEVRKTVKWISEDLNINGRVKDIKEAKTIEDKIAIIKSPEKGDVDEAVHKMNGLIGKQTQAKEKSDAVNKVKRILRDVDSLDFQSLKIAEINKLKKIKEILNKNV